MLERLDNRRHRVVRVLVEPVKRNTKGADA